MHLDKYEVFTEPNREDRYWFISKGSNGAIKKIVEIDEMEEPYHFNLALGDYVEGKANFINVTNNNDTKKVLATITEIINHYINKFPQRIIFITGDTEVKTRLYQIHISNNLEEILEAGYFVEGKPSGNAPFEPFKKGKRYEAFLVRKV